jgi:large subunit ribosomal protein L22
MEGQILEARAVQRHLRKASRKLRLVANAIRGKNVDRALAELDFMKQDASIYISKVVKSAAANIRDKFDEERLDNDMLYVKEIFVDEGVTLKRIQPAPMGRAHRINKRSSHITVVVAKREETSIND